MFKFFLLVVLFLLLLSGGFIIFSVSFLKSIAQKLFGVNFTQTQSGRQQQAKQQQAAQQQRTKTQPQPEVKEKLIDANEGEYVDFEEIK